MIQLFGHDIIDKQITFCHHDTLFAPYYLFEESSMKKTSMFYYFSHLLICYLIKRKRSQLEFQYRKMYVGMQMRQNNPSPYFHILTLYYVASSDIFIHAFFETSCLSCDLISVTTTQPLTFILSVFIIICSLSSLKIFVA